jgi:uncharacterized RDD family membrane protein YckC
VRAARPRTIVTPEHVEIRLDPAGLGSRFVALVIDLAIVLGASSVVAHLALYALPPALGMLVNALALLLLSWGYHVFFEVRAQGQPPGKRIVGIRVVDGRGLPLSVEQSFVRNVVRVLDALPVGYALGALSCLLDPQRRGGGGAGRPAPPPGRPAASPPTPSSCARRARWTSSGARPGPGPSTACARPGS